MSPSPPRWPALLAIPLAILVALAALGGILLPSTYARETASWAAQGTGQDWVDLIVVAPFLAFAGAAVRRGSRAFTLVLGGVLIYLVYSFVLYGFAVHFNSLFLLYCATLGLSFFTLAALAVQLLREDVGAWFDERAPRRLLGVFLIASAVLFAMLWLSEDLPAMLRGQPPASLAEVGLATNPIHVLDLAIVLPAMALGGIGLLRRRSALGWILGPWMASFAVFMNVAIAGMMVAMRLRGVPTEPAIIAIFGALTAASLVVLILFLRRLHSA